MAEKRRIMSETGLINDKKENLTVLTATYNRSQMLSRLYESLKAQTKKSFDWLIVDDGSEDDTGVLVKRWAKDSPFAIYYIKKENGGKHTALNVGIREIKSELTFIVDSDDQLIAKAVEIILDYHEIYKAENLCGYSFFRKTSAGEYQHKGMLPENGIKENFVQCRINRNLSGDMAEVWYTHCLLEYPFPEYRGEKFIGEDTVWLQMAANYEMRFFSDAIYISDYLPGGLTDTRRKRNIESPKGCVARAEVFLESKVAFKYKIKAMLQYQIYGRFAGYKRKTLYKKTQSKVLYLALFFPSQIIYMAWK